MKLVVKIVKIIDCQGIPSNKQWVFIIKQDQNMRFLGKDACINLMFHNLTLIFEYLKLKNKNKSLDILLDI
jgi:hypothetical protein